MLLFLLAAWKFPEVLHVVTDVFEDSVPAPEMLEENAHQSHEDGREAYEKVADLKSLEAESIPDITRQATEMTSVPERLAATISAEQARALPPEAVMFIAPERKPTPTIEPPTDSPLRRRRPTRPLEFAAVPDLDETELPAEALPDEIVPEEQASPQIPAQAKPISPTNPDRAESIDTPIPTRPDANQPAPAKIEINDTPTIAALDSKPFQRRPRNRRVNVAAAESKLPDLPNIESDVASDPVELPNTDIQRSPSATKSEQPKAVTAKVTANEPVPIRVAPNSPMRTVEPSLDNTLPTTLPIPLTQRVRRSRTVAVVASLDADNTKIPSATEIPVEPTVEGTRPQFKRSAAATTSTPTTIGSSPPSSIPNIRPTQVSPAEAATKRSDVEVTETTQPNLPPQLRRNRTGRRRVVDVVVAATGTDSQPNTEELITEANPLASAKANLDRNQTPQNRASAASESVAQTGTLPDSVASQLKPMSVPTPKQSRLLIAKTSTNGLASPLRRRRSVSAKVNVDVEQTTEPADSPNGDSIATADMIQASETTLERREATQLTTDVTTPREISGPMNSVRNRIIVGELSEKNNDAPPAFSPVASRLNRKRARAMKIALAEDNVGLQAIFTLRQGDTRRKHIELLGGSQETERAVNLGLEWLAKNQSEDGSWDLRKHQGNTHSMTAGTGLGLLPFLAAGYAHTIEGQYRDVVAKAIKRLVDNQQDSGELVTKGDAQRMYSHGIAAIALCEAFAMSQDQELRVPAQKALDFIVSAQHKPSGGWRYNPNESADTSVVGWQMMALKSGEMAGLKVPTSSYELVKKWLHSVESKKGPGGTYGYQNRNATPAMTAEGLLCLQFMGTRRNDPKLRYGADFILRSLPEKSQKLTSYYWYYATQAMYHMQGEYWETWNERTKEVLISTQVQGGKNAGTWNPRDNWEKAGGRVYATSIKLLMLEVYYRHLPLYDQLEF